MRLGDRDVLRTLFPHSYTRAEILFGDSQYADIGE